MMPAPNLHDTPYDEERFDEETASEVEPRIRVEDDAWRELLIKKTVGRGDEKREVVMSTSENVATIVRYHPQWRDVLAYDAFSETIVSLKPPPWHPADAPTTVEAGEWSEADSARAAHWLARVEGLHVSPKLVDQAIAVVAESKVVHPVRDYLCAVAARWDGKKRLEHLLHVYFGADDTPYTQGMGTRWMISAVARIFRPGCQADCTLILESPRQGTGKTSGFRALVPETTWYADTGINIGDKDSYQNLRGVWIYGLDELDSLRGRDVTKTKNFLSQTVDRYRPSYGRRARSYLRQNVFCGTTNEEEYLHDRTGNRRLWPARVRRDVDVAAIASDRDMLWAEAVVRFEAGEKWHVDTPEFRRLCEEEQADRVAPESWEPIIAAWLEEPYELVEEPDDQGRPRLQRYPYDSARGVLTVDVLRYALRMRPADIGKPHQMRAAEALRALGYERGPKRRENGAQVHRYLKVSPESSQPGVPTEDAEKKAVTPTLGTPGTPTRARTREDTNGSPFPAEIQTADRGGPGVPSDPKPPHGPLEEPTPDAALLTQIARRVTQGSPLRPVERLVWDRLPEGEQKRWLGSCWR